VVTAKAVEALRTHPTAKKIISKYLKDFIVHFSIPYTPSLVLAWIMILLV
jgi:hypothetical protein